MALADALLAVAPKADAGVWRSALAGTMTEFDISTPLRQAHFLGQLAHESSGLTRLAENLNYSADGLLRTFRKYFTSEQAAEYARQPERIANRVYANRMDNGDEASGDGWLFRGRGPIQLTGRRNYRAAGKALGLDLEANPNLVTVPAVGARVAGWFWQTNGINAHADRNDVAAVTKAINGGHHGLTERMVLTELAKRALLKAVA